ncbi:MAG: prepilin-type N-terminal cleavage/methylation domain-containing protein [Verrucomicrobia subdivision 3 bacterium]|nr:prepilin-type N-terminal cleavage/methylation domain-containing protein [Limisphaerales bacterium]
MRHHSISVNKNKALSRERRGFTLVEMVVVLAIAIGLMAIMLPALKGLRGDKYSLSATTQLIADFNNARLEAINGGSPVYVVFMPKFPSNVDALSDEEKTYFQNNQLANQQLGGQLISYAFFAEYALGDNLGQPSRRWVSDWKYLPEGAYLPSGMLGQLKQANVNSPEPLLRVPHLGNDAQVDLKWHLPYIGFDARGRLLGVKPATPDSKGVVIRLVEGGVLPPEKRANGAYLLGPSDEPLTTAKVQNSILINYLTGRPNTMGVTTVPPAMKAVTVKVIFFSNRAWKGGGEGMAKAISDWAGINNAQYNANWGGAYRNNNDRWELRQGARAPVVISGITASLANKLLHELQKTDPSVDLLIE